MLLLFRANSGSTMRSIALLLLLYLSIAIAAPTRDTNCSAIKDYEQKWNVDQSICPEMKEPINAIGVTQPYFACLLYNTTSKTLCNVDSFKINPEEINNQTNKIKTLDEVCKTLEANIDKIDNKDALLQTLKGLLHNSKACEKICSYLTIDNNNKVVYNPINQCVASAVILSALHPNESTPVERTDTPKNNAPIASIDNTSKLKPVKNLEQSIVDQTTILANVKSPSQDTQISTTTKKVMNNVDTESNGDILTKPDGSDKTQNNLVERPIVPAQNAPEEQSQQTPSPQIETQQQAKEIAEEDVNQETNISDNISPQITSTQKAVIKESVALPSADGNMPNDNQYVKSEESEFGQDGDMDEEVFKEPEPKEKPPVTNEDSVSNPNYPNQPIAEDDSYFFSYFMMVCILFVLCYVGYHNKQKILALLLEGRKGKKQQRRRPNSANYHKLDSNLEEAVTSACNKNSASVIY